MALLQNKQRERSIQDLSSVGTNLPVKNARNFVVKGDKIYPGNLYSQIPISCPMKDGDLYSSQILVILL